MALPTYTAGTVSVNNGATTVVGSGTIWSGVNVREGDFFVRADGMALITEVTDTTHLKITPWPGVNVAGGAYTIEQNFVGRVVGVAAAEDVATLIAQLSTAVYTSGDQSLNGKIAFANATEATGIGTTAAALFAGGVEIAKKLFVVGAVSLSSTLAVAGDLAVATNKFTVASATGNTAVAGTLGVTGLLTASGGLTIAGSAIIMSGNITAAGWTTNGVQFKGVAATFTDNSTAAGTVAAAYSSVGGGNTIATAVNAVTFTDYFEEYFKAPIAGAHVTLTNGWAIGADNIKIGTATPLTVSSAGLVAINNATASSSTTTGAVVITGGLGVVGNANIGGVTNFTNATTATAHNSAAVVLAGGLGVADRIFCGNGSAGGSLSLNGPGGTNNGPAVFFRYNSAFTFAFGRSAGILGGTSDDFIITAAERADGVASIDITRGVSTPSGGVVSFMNGLGTPAGGSTSARILFGGGNLGIYWGSGAPTVSAAQGSLYLRTDGAQNARLYLNNNGSTGWSTFNTLT